MQLHFKNYNNVGYWVWISSPTKESKSCQLTNRFYKLVPCFIHNSTCKTGTLVPCFIHKSLFEKNYLIYDCSSGTLVPKVCHDFDKNNANVNYGI